MDEVEKTLYGETASVETEDPVTPLVTEFMRTVVIAKETTRKASQVEDRLENNL